MTTFLKHLEERRGLCSRIFADNGMPQMRMKEKNMALIYMKINFLTKQIL